MKIAKQNTRADFKVHMRSLRKARTNIWDIMYSIGIPETTQDADLQTLRKLLDHSCDVLTDCITLCKVKSEGGHHAH